jgi:ankyrin repeat protein
VQYLLALPSEHQAPQQQSSKHPRCVSSSLTATDCWGRLALHWAAAEAHQGTAASLVAAMQAARVPLNAKDGGGATPTQLAASRRHVQLVTLLLEAAAASAPGQGLAAHCEGCAAAAPHAAHPAPPAACGGRGMTALHLAAQNGLESVVAQLLEVRTCNPSLTDADGNTALHWAATAGSAGVCKLLLSVGVNPGAVAADGCTPLHRAGGSVEVADALIAGGAPVRAHASGDGGTALHAAAGGGHAAVCRCLLDAGCPVDAVNAAGSTALYAAASAGHLEACTVLLEAGADPDIAPSNGNTPLHLAAQKGSVEIIDLLAGEAGREGGAEP